MYGTGIPIPYNMIITKISILVHYCLQNYFYCNRLIHRIIYLKIEVYS